MENYTKASIAVLALSFALSLYFYPSMPGTMASHWGLYGEANGYSGKDFALFFLPLLSIAVFALLSYLPKTDPIKENVAKNKHVYGWLVFAVLAFLSYVHLLSIRYNLGALSSIGPAMSLGFAFLFYFIGDAMGKMKRNWFMGIRTPWAMGSDGNWAKTHALGGKLFKACAALSLLGVVFERFAIILVIVPVLLAAIACFVYSYLLYRKEGGKGKKKGR
ncbi:MAG: SdpI family protein [Candidatus Micrarchaeia archaeon]|jgi:uncharacterized membrane protein